MSSTKRARDRRKRSARILREIAPGSALAFTLLWIPLSCSDQASLDAPDAASPDAPGSDATPLADASTDAKQDAARRTVECSVTPCARDLSASWSESFCALLDDGRVVCWGRNEAGQLGRDAGPWSATPQPVEGLANAVALDRTCAVVEDGGVLCWGPPAQLEPDAGPIVQVALPRARSVRAGDDVACAILDDGSVACWGRQGPDGVLDFADAGAAGSLVPPTVVPLDGVIDEIALARGMRAECSFCPARPIHAVLARRKDGTVLSWGLAPLLGRPTPRHPDPDPERVPVDGVDHLAGGFGGCVSSGAIPRCWGHRPDDVGGEPEPVPGLPNALQLALGDYRHSGGADRFGRGCATTSAGAVFCWGENGYGQAGDGTKTLRAGPVKVEGLPEPVVRVEVTRGTTCALGVSGRIHCWGDDGFGQRGQKTPFTKKALPLPVELP